MEQGNGCALFNATKDKVSPASFLSEGHVHIVVRSGELTFSDGTQRLYGTNTTDWRAGIAGPVVHAAIFDGEEYDARISLPDAFARLLLPTQDASAPIFEECLHPKQEVQAFSDMMLRRDYLA